MSAAWTVSCPSSFTALSSSEAAAAEMPAEHADPATTARVKYFPNAARNTPGKKPRETGGVKRLSRPGRPRRTHAQMLPEAGIPRYSDARGRGDVSTNRASWDEYFMAIARAGRDALDLRPKARRRRDRARSDDPDHRLQRLDPRPPPLRRRRPPDGGRPLRAHRRTPRPTPSCKRRATACASDGADIYVTASPCFGCFKLIANSGLSRIVFGEFYRDERIFDFSRQLGIELVHLPPASPPGPA